MYCRSIEILPNNVQRMQQKKYRTSNESTSQSVISKIRSQINLLKTMHHELSDTINRFVALFSKEILTFYSSIAQIQAPKHNKIQDIQPSSQDSFFKLIQNNDQKLKIKGKLQSDSLKIKDKISNKVRELRELQDKQNLLRKTNQKLMKERATLSNEYHLHSYEKTEITPEKLFRQVRTRVATQGNDKDNHLIRKNSPSFKKIQSKIGKENIFRQPTILNHTTKESVKASTFKTSKSETLKCPNGHQFYQGQIINEVPHGKGTLINCCSFLPFKIHSKVIDYTGTFKNGLFEGIGTLNCKGNIRFEGKFKRGMRHGEGILFFGQVGEIGRWEYDKLL